MANVKSNVFAGLKNDNDEPKQAPKEKAAPERAKREIITEYDVAKIKPSKDNTFSQVKDAQYEELIESIKADGIHEPLKIMPDPKKADQYIILSGHRRFAAAKQIGLTKVPCVLIKGEFTPEEIIAKLFAYNQGKRGDDPFGKAMAAKRHIELNAKLPKAKQVSVEKAFNLPHGRSAARLTTLAKLDKDILELGQLGMLTAELGEKLIAAREDSLDEAQDKIREAYASEKTFEAQKAAVRKCISYLTRLPKKEGGASPVVATKRIKKEVDKLSSIDLSSERPKRKRQLKEQLEEIKAVIDAKLAELE